MRAAIEHYQVCYGDSVVRAIWGRMLQGNENQVYSYGVVGKYRNERGAERSEWTTDKKAISEINRDGAANPRYDGFSVTTLQTKLCREERKHSKSPLR